MRPVARRLAALCLAATLLGPRVLAADEAACVDCVDPALLALVPPDMQYRRAPIADAANGFAALQKAAEMVGDGELPHGVPFGSEPLSDRKRAAIAAWLTANAAALALVDEAINAPAFQLPLFDLSLRWSPIRRATKLKVARAQLRAADQKWEEAAADLLDAFALGQRMFEGDPVLLSYLMAGAVQSDALRGMRCLAAAPGLPPAIVARLATAVAAAPDLCDAYAHALRVELTTWLVPHLLQTLGEGDATQLTQRLLDDSACSPERRCRAVLARLLASHPQPFVAADTVRTAGDSMARLASACRDAAAGAAADDSLGYPPPLAGILAALLEGGRLTASRGDVDQAVAQFAAAPNPLGRYAARASSYRYLPTSRRSERATTLMLLATRLYGDLTADEAARQP